MSSCLGKQDSVEQALIGIPLAHTDLGDKVRIGPGLGFGVGAHHGRGGDVMHPGLPGGI